jgi:hypothetical protein
MHLAIFPAKILDLHRFATFARAAARDAVAALMFCALAAATPGATAATLPLIAQIDDVFTVLEVEVDITAKTAAVARELALAEGQIQAFRRLMTRLVPRRDHASVPPLGGEAVAELVRNFEVDQEKTSSVRYIATLKVRFNPSRVRDLLRRAGVPFAETASKPVLVLPVLRKAGALLLWDDVNIWRRAWAALPQSDGLVPMIMPAADLADINDIGPEQAARGDEDRLRVIAARYGAADVLLALANQGTDPNQNVPTLQVTVSRFGAVGQARTLVRAFAGNAGEKIGRLMARAALDLSTGVEETWKSDNLLRFNERRRLTAIARIGGLADWIELRRRLKRIAFIQTSDLRSLSRTEATVLLSYLGDEEQLILALAQRDLTLSREPLSWVLRFGSAPNQARNPQPGKVE